MADLPNRRKCSACALPSSAALLIVSIVGAWNDPYSRFGSNGALGTCAELSFLTFV